LEEDVMAAELEVADLIERMSVRVLNGTCTFIIANNTPPEWRVRITDGGCKFFYSDGTDDTDGPRNLMLDSGMSANFYSQDSTKCVKQCFLAINVSVPDEGTQPMTYTSEMAPKDQCWTQNGVELGQKLSVAEVDLSKSGKAHRLGLFATNR
jgi:hypothetical protein